MPDKRYPPPPEKKNDEFQAKNFTDFNFTRKIVTFVYIILTDFNFTRKIVTLVYIILTDFNFMRKNCRDRIFIFSTLFLIPMLVFLSNKGLIFLHYQNIHKDFPLFGQAKVKMLDWRRQRDCRLLLIWGTFE